MPQTLVQSSQPDFSFEGSGRNPQMPFSGIGMPSPAGQKSPLMANFPNADSQIQGPSAFVSRIGHSGFDSSAPEMQSVAKPAPTGVLPSVNMHGSHRPALLTSLPTHEKIGYQPDMVGHQGMNMSNFHGQQLGTVESKSQNNMPQFSSQHHGLIPLNQHVRAPTNLQQPQSLPSREARPIRVPPVSVVAPSNLVRPSLNQRYVPQAHSVPVAMGTGFQNLVAGVLSSMPMPGTVNASWPSVGGAIPPLSQVLPPISSTMMPIPQNLGSIGPNPSAGGALSGLFNSLMAQGLISVTKEAPMQVGTLQF